MRVTHGFEKSAWNLTEYRLINNAPWEAELIVDQTAAHTLTMFDGSNTARQVLKQLREVANVGVNAYAALIHRLVGAGVVEVV